MSLTPPPNAPFLYVLDEEMRILVVDDDPILREFATAYLATPVEQVALFADLGCDEMQGFFLGRPLPAAEVASEILKDLGKQQGRGGETSFRPPATAGLGTASLHR